MSKRLSAVSLFLLLFLGLSTLIISGNRGLLFHTEVHEISDLAVNALQIEQAKHFRELYGNYSRFQFNHPGPAFFTLYGFAERVLHDAFGLVPSPYNAHLIGGILTQSAFFALALVLLADLLGHRRVIPIALAVGAAHFSRAGNVFISIWPPEVLLMPFLAFVASCAGVATGRLHHLPWAILSGSFLVHGHVTQPLFVGALFVGAYSTAAYGARRAGVGWTGPVRQHPVAHGVAGLLLLLFLAPIAIDLSRGAESNVAAILRHVQTNIAGDKSILQSILFFLGFISYTRQPELLLATEAGYPSLYGRPLVVAVWCLALIVIVAALWRRRPPQPENDGFRAIVALWAVCVPLCVVWGLSQTGPMYAFNGHFYYGLHFLVYVLAAFILTERIPHRAQVWLVPPTLAAAAVGLLFFVRHNAAYADPDGLRIKDTTLQALALEEGTAGANAPKLLAFDGDRWSEAASIGLALRRAGADFRTSPGWKFMFQSRYIARREELESPNFPYNVWRLVAEPRVSPALPLPRGRHLVFEPPPLSPADGRIRFDVDEFYDYYVSGVSGPVPHDGAWTDSSEAVLQFQPEPTTASVNIHLVAYPFLIQDRVPLQPTELWFNDHLVFSSPFVGPGVLRALIPAEYWNERKIATIRLHLPNAHAPARMGLWGDTRFLALCLQELRTFLEPPASN